MIEKLEHEDNKEEVVEVIVDPNSDRAKIEAKAIQIFGEDNVDFDIKGGIIIRFPEVDITNGERTETLYSLYVQLYWQYGKEEETKDSVQSFSNYMMGFRNVFTYPQLYAKYIHSHLPAMETIFEEEDEDYNEHAYRLEVQNFCLGTSDIETLFSGLQLGFNMDTFTMLLNAIDDYVRWESIDGGPHILMEQISKSGKGYEEINHNTLRPLETTTVKEFYKQVDIETLKEHYFVPDSTYTSMSTRNAFTDYIENLFKDPYALSSYNAHKLEGKYYQLRGANPDSMKQVVNDIEIELDFPEFKGEWLQLDILPFEVEDSLLEKIKKEGIMVVHPSISAQLQKHIENDLHKYVNKQDKWELKK